MSRYTDSVLAAARHRYENTNQPLRSIAAELLIGERNLQRLVTTHGWAKRSERVQGLPVAMQLLEEAKALAAKQSQPCHSREGGNPVIADGAKSEPPGVPGPRRSLSSGRALRGPVGGDDTPESASASNSLLETPSPTLPLAGGGNQTAIERIEALVLKEIEVEEAARAQLGGKQRMATASERSARTLATLTQTLHALARLRAGSLPDQETHYDDDMPRDIDEFRRDLARRIDAFVASRTDAADADGDSGHKPVDQAG